MSQTKLCVVVDEDASLTLKQSHLSLSGFDDSFLPSVNETANLVNGNTRVLLSRGSVLTHTYVQELSGKCSLCPTIYSYIS